MVQPIKTMRTSGGSIEKFATTIGGKCRNKSLQLLALLPLLLLVPVVQANDNLRVAYQWKQVDFNYPNAAARANAIQSGAFVPENVIPVGLEVYKQRLFMTLPRWKTGVPASLVYIDMAGKHAVQINVCICVSSEITLLWTLGGQQPNNHPTSHPSSGVQTNSASTKRYANISLVRSGANFQKHHKLLLTIRSEPTECNRIALHSTDDPTNTLPCIILLFCLPLPPVQTD